MRRRLSRRPGTIPGLFVDNKVNNSQRWHVLKNS
nr:MAG TPA: hypothetical protein [Caudoviricetes sp.]